MKYPATLKLTPTLKFTMKQGLQDQTRVQRQGDF